MARAADRRRLSALSSRLKLFSVTELGSIQLPTPRLNLRAAYVNNRVFLISLASGLRFILLVGSVTTQIMFAMILTTFVPHSHPTLVLSSLR